MRDRDGAVEGIFVFAFEVTDQVSARRRVEALVEALRLADQRKDEFLEMLAHELLNPWPPSACRSRCSETWRARRPDRRATARSPGGRWATSCAWWTISSTRSRITRGTVKLRLEDVDLAAAVRNAAAAVSPAVQARRHALSVEVGPGDFGMRADATRRSRWSRTS